MGTDFSYVHKPWHIGPVLFQYFTAPGIEFNLPGYLHPSPL